MFQHTPWEYFLRTNEKAERKARQYYPLLYQHLAGPGGEVIWCNYGDGHLQDAMQQHGIDTTLVKPGINKPHYVWCEHKLVDQPPFTFEYEHFSFEVTQNGGDGWTKTCRSDKLIYGFETLPLGLHIWPIFVDTYVFHQLPKLLSWFWTLDHSTMLPKFPERGNPGGTVKLPIALATEAFPDTERFFVSEEMIQQVPLRASKQQLIEALHLRIV